jgi:hypothetical protein
MHIKYITICILKGGDHEDDIGIAWPPDQWGHEAHPLQDKNRSDKKCLGQLDYQREYQATEKVLRPNQAGHRSGQVAKKMKSVLVDSSIWIDYFSGKLKAAALDQLIDHNLICVNGLILAELTPALKLQKQHRLIELLNTVEEIPITIDWERIIEYQCSNLKHGINKVGIADLIVLQNVIDHDLTLFTAAKHFSLMQSHIEFSLYKIPESWNRVAKATQKSKDLKINPNAGGDGFWNLETEPQWLFQWLFG